MSRFYYHGIIPKKEPLERLCTMIEIIRSGGLKSKRKLNISNLYVGYNGSDYISLCRKENNYMYNRINDNINAYEDYIYSNFCFIISDEIDAIKTNDFDSQGKYVSYMDFLSVANGDIRYSDMFDEWQVKDEIKLDKIIGIGLPFSLVHSYKYCDKEFEQYLHELYAWVRYLNLDIVNTDDFNFVECYEKEKNDKCKYYFN